MLIHRFKYRNVGLCVCVQGVCVLGVTVCVHCPGRGVRLKNIWDKYANLLLPSTLYTPFSFFPLHSTLPPPSSLYTLHSPLLLPITLYTPSSSFLLPSTRALHFLLLLPSQLYTPSSFIPLHSTLPNPPSLYTIQSLLLLPSTLYSPSSSFTRSKLGFPANERFCGKMRKFSVAYRKLFCEISHFFAKINEAKFRKMSDVF